MNFEIVWEPLAVDLATRFLRDDPTGLEALMVAIDSLAEHPTPVSAIRLGSSDLYRLRVESYRAVYEIDEESSTIRIRHVGRRI